MIIIRNWVHSRFAKYCVLAENNYNFVLRHLSFDRTLFLQKRFLKTNGLLLLKPRRPTCNKIVYQSLSHFSPWNGHFLTRCLSPSQLLQSLYLFLQRETLLQVQSQHSECGSWLSSTYELLLEGGSKRHRRGIAMVQRRCLFL